MPAIAYNALTHRHNIQNSQRSQLYCDKRCSEPLSRQKAACGFRSTVSNVAVGCRNDLIHRQLIPQLASLPKAALTELTVGRRVANL